MNNTEVTKTKLSIPEGRGMAQKIYEYLCECNVARSCGGKIKEFKVWDENKEPVVRLRCEPVNNFTEVSYRDNLIAMGLADILKSVMKRFYKQGVAQ